MPNADTRELLAELGIGDFNATMVIPLMMLGPAQTDPDMTDVQMLTVAMQKMMQRMGASWITADGFIGQDTAYCLHALSGQRWNERRWYDLAQMLVSARRAGKKFSQTYGAVQGKPPVSLSGLGLLPTLPDVPVPGGIFTVAIGAYLLYRHFKKR